MNEDKVAKKKRNRIPFAEKLATMDGRIQQKHQELKNLQADRASMIDAHKAAIQALAAELPSMSERPVAVGEDGP